MSHMPLSVMRSEVRQTQGSSGTAQGQKSQEPAPRCSSGQDFPVRMPVLHGYKEEAPRMGRHLKHSYFLSSSKTVSLVSF